MPGLMADGLAGGGTLLNAAHDWTDVQYGVATLNGYVFRINPMDISWTFAVKTNVQNTVGGRVVQVMGATLSDLTISGQFGQDQKTSGNDGPGMSWRLAQEFVAKVRELIQFQSRDAKRQGEMGMPLRFTYSALSPDGLNYNWDFECYIKGYRDADGSGVIEHRTGKFSYAYQLILFPVEDASARVLKAGVSQGVFDIRRAEAIDGFISRMADGIGWKKTGFNDPKISTDIYGRPMNVSNDQPFIAGAPTDGSDPNYTNVGQPPPADPPPAGGN